MREGIANKANSDNTLIKSKKNERRIFGPIKEFAFGKMRLQQCFLQFKYWCLSEKKHEYIHTLAFNMNIQNTWTTYVHGHQ